MYNSDSYIIIAKIIKPHGIKGELSITPYTDDVENFINKYKILYLKTQNDFSVVDVEKYALNIAKNRLILKLKDICDRNQAENLRNEFLYIKKDNLPETQDGEYYKVNLIGCSCYLNDFVSETNSYFGKVKDMFNFGATDLFNVELESGEMVNIPFLNKLLKTIDIDNKQIIFSDLEGYI